MLKLGDVVFVSAASGAVGSVVCQVAKLKGHTVIGSAGGGANPTTIYQRPLKGDHGFRHAFRDGSDVGDLTS